MTRASVRIEPSEQVAAGVRGSAAVSTIVWVWVVLALWPAVAVLVSLVVCGVIRRRDEQVPRSRRPGRRTSHKTATADDGGVVSRP